MARYYYKAVSQAGRIVEGHIEASNEADLESRVSNMDLDIIRYRAQRQPLMLQRGNVRNKDLIAFTFHLEQLLKAGVPLVDALSDLRDSTDQGVFKDIVASLIENIGTGNTFSESLALHPKIFSNVYVSMIHVGESSGQLVDVLKDLTGMLRWQYELTAKAKKMMVYPIFVFVVVISVILFLMTYLVPQLVPFIKMAGEEIPWYTEVLIHTSDFFLKFWYLFMLLPVVVIVMLKYVAKLSPSMRQAVDKVKLNFPLFGPMAYKIKIARFCNYFALMYASGITILDAIAMGKRVMNNSILEDALDRAHEQITDGESISIAFANVGLFPALVVRMLRVGENTGAMSEALLNVSYFFDSEVKDAIETLEPAVMPAITIFLGTIVGWIMLSIMGPIYDAVVTLSAF